MKWIVIIPARLESTRLPQKLLIKIKGKTVLQRTYEQVLKVVPKEKIWVATDSVEIKSHMKDLGCNVKLTSDNNLTGTDRVAEMAQHFDCDYYINVQGDEPLFNPKDISKMIRAVESGNGEIFNGYTKIDSDEDYRSLSVPKVVFRPNGNLLYMSRSPIPGNKIGEFSKSWRQICIYGFPKEALKAFKVLNKKTNLEQEEDIEILRFLEMGYDVKMIEMSDTSIAVDTPEDIEKVQERLLRHE